MTSKRKAFAADFINLVKSHSLIHNVTYLI